MKGIMIQGTSSDAGKSFLVTGLCRLLADRGIRVCPFKSQNMSNNSCVTWDGLEISRAQAVQAEAARLRPEAFMNPILLKPRRDTCSEIVLEGRPFEAPADREYYRTFTMTRGIEAVRRALGHIAGHFDAVVIEGAGSPAEVNLNATEIVNMRVAREADVPVLLVTDVDRGGSLASVVGTLELLGSDRSRVKGVVFNKFRGDPALFSPAIQWLEARNGVRVAGVMPWVGGASIAGEDSLSLRWGRGGGGADLMVGVVRFPGIANFTDLDPFEFEPDVELIGLDEETPAKVLRSLDAIVLPGSRNAAWDMAWLRETGLAERLRAFVDGGGSVFGLGGGFQMMGRRLERPGRETGKIGGLGLLPAVTDLGEESGVVRISGKVNPELVLEVIPVEGYRTCVGRTQAEDGVPCVPLFLAEGRTEGLALPGLRVAGTSLCGVFENDRFRALWLNALRNGRGLEERAAVDTAGMKERAYDTLARAVEEHLDVAWILEQMGL
ncbi:cobyric acid synthase [Fretibacterium sp. OH1220_COT-178]|uniref:cobyric acid synthase n=1 Tax=Fretibacterium sp. OH1220_COT-178 TaxID=2491047 RepID=UPI000F5DC22F|nr:cobyric acid synthase [Fretibacterium sp. OH1220_COT-178]RRD65590.1 cobyric acid synthase [Fretibacterium sp. OH1220_COT-178]